MAKDFIKGTEYLVAKHQGPREYSVAIFAEGHTRGELIDVLDKDFKTKGAAITAIKKLLVMFPDIEITYLDEDSSDVDPWFRDWEYRNL
jgi:hypothetical protein